MVPNQRHHHHHHSSTNWSLSAPSIRRVMPPPPPGGTKKKKKGRPPKHQNSFAFRHNPKSKKTDKILASPIVGVCRRCYDKIEWRKKYRKVCGAFHCWYRVGNKYWVISIPSFQVHWLYVLFSFLVPLPTPHNNVVQAAISAWKMQYLLSKECSSRISHDLHKLRMQW